MPKQHVQLTPTDRDTLTALITKGDQKARIYKRALGLLELDRGKTYTQVAKTLGMTGQTLSHWAKKYRTLGLDGLKDAPRPGRPVEMTGKQRAQITALACSTPPAGHGRWTLRLLADHCVALGSCEHLSHTHVKTILKKRIEAPLEENMVHPQSGCVLSRTHGSLALAV